MKYYIIAGEASGDLHGSNLVAAIKNNDNKAVFRGCGGDLMKNQGVDLLFHYRRMAFMGFAEVAINIDKVLTNIKKCKQDLLEFAPDAVILVDYPGFNMRIAQFAHRHNIKVYYYISPQVWAWKKHRVNQIRKYVDKMLVILPFEEQFYRNNNVDAVYVGNPLLDELSKERRGSAVDYFKRNKLNKDDKHIAILPGSRRQEVKKMLPAMLEVMPEFPDYHFVVACAPSIDEDLCKSIIGDKKNVSIVKAQTYDVLQNSYAALVTSGTATLETALLMIPEVVCYKTSRSSYLIARYFAKVKYICLVNIILDKPVVKELIQGDLNKKNLVEELNKILNNPKHQRKLLEDYDTLRQKLGGEGASQRAADIITEMTQMSVEHKAQHNLD